MERVLSQGAGEWPPADEAPALRELWRAGGAGEAERLSYPSGLAVADDGRVAVAERVAGEVVIIAADRPRAVWPHSDAAGAAGYDPPESPAAVAWGGDGRLAVLDRTGPAVVFLREGVVERRLPVRIGDEDAKGAPWSEGVVWLGVQPDGGVLWIPAGRPLGGDPASARRVRPLLRVPPGGDRIDTLLVDTVRTLGGERYAGAGVPGEAETRVAVAPSGGIVVAGIDDRYRLVVMDSAGRTVRVVCRDAAPFGVSSRERGMVADPSGPPGLVARIRGAPVADDPAAVGHVFVGTGGRLWVQRNRPAPLPSAPWPGVPGAIHDVFDPAGSYLGTVTAPEGLHLLAARGDTVYGLERGATGEVQLVALERVP